MANFLTRLSQTAFDNISQVMPVVTFHETAFADLPLTQEFLAHDHINQTNASSTTNYSYALIEGKDDNKQYEQQKQSAVIPHQNDESEANKNVNPHEMQTSLLRSVNLPSNKFTQEETLNVDSHFLNDEHTKVDTKQINSNKLTIQNDISEDKVNKNVNLAEHNLNVFTQKKSLPNAEHSKEALPLNDLNKEENKQKNYSQAQKTFFDDEHESIQQLKNNELSDEKQRSTQITKAAFESREKILDKAMLKSQFAKFENFITNEAEQKNDGMKEVSIQLKADKQVTPSSIKNNKLELLEKIQASIQNDNSSHLSNNKQLSLPKIKITINRLHVRGLNKHNPINKKVIPRASTLSLKEYLNQSFRHGDSAE